MLTFHLLHIIDEWHTAEGIRAYQGRCHKWFSGNSRRTMSWIFTE